MDTIVELQRQINALQNKLDRLATVEIIKSTTLAEASTGVKRDALGSIPVSRASGTAIYSLDASATGSSITIANGAGGTATPIGAIAFRGLAILWSSGDGVGALYFCDAGGITVISDRAGIFAAADTASKICLFLSGGNFTIKNNRGSSITVSVSLWRVG